MPLGKKVGVVIPEAFLTDNELKIAVIRGIFDTDGSIHLMRKPNRLYPSIEITSISLKLVEQLLQILKELGLRPTSYNWLSKKGNRQRAYKIMIRGDKMLDKFMNVIKPANPKHIRKYNFFKESFK